MNRVKTAVACFFAAVSAWLGVLAVPVYVLVLVNLADYFTGIAASVFRKEAVSSYRGIRGIVKKVCMWLLVGVGAAVDWMLLFAAQAAGAPAPFRFFTASLVAVWLVCNEIISILENISEIGVGLPPFLVRLVKGIQKQVESGADGISEKK